MAESRLRLLQLEKAATIAGGQKTYVVTASDTTGIAEWESLANLVPGFETLTSLTYNSGTGNFQYTDEDGTINNIDAPVLEKSDITITASRGITLSGGGTLTITDSNGTPRGLQYAGNYTTTYNNLSLVHKGYVDALITGNSWKDSVRAATTGNITLSGIQTIDGVVLADGDRVLVKDQTDASENGIYEVSSGAWTRTDDADIFNEIVSASVYVSEGSTQADTQWVCISDEGGTLGVTDVDWTQFFGGASITASNENTGGVGVFKQKSGNNLEFRGINAGSSKITVALDSGNNEIDIDVAEAQITHDNLGGVVANEHIDHSTVSINTGTGLTGGGNITTSRTISLSHLGLESLTDPNADRIFYWDDSGGASDWLTVGTGLTITSATDTIDVDLLGIEDLSDPGADRILFWDDSSGATKWLEAGTGLSISDTTLRVADNTSLQQVIVEDNGSLVGQRPRLNFIEGTDITLTIAEDAGNDEIDITVAYSGGASPNVYRSISDGTTTATASGGDTFKFRSANNRLSVAVQDNDATHGDNLLLTINEGNIVHDNLSGVSSNEHIDHTTVTMTAGDGLTGGGNISANRTFDVDWVTEKFTRTTGSTVEVSGTLPTDTTMMIVTRNGVIQAVGASNDYTLSGNTITFTTSFGGYGPFSAGESENVIVKYPNGA